MVLALDDVVIRSQLQGGHSGALIPFAGDDDERNLQTAVPCFSQQIEPIHVWKPEIDKDQIESVCQRTLQGFASRAHDLEAEMPRRSGQGHLRQIDVRLIVLDIEDAALPARSSWRLVGRRRTVSDGVPQHDR